MGLAAGAILGQKDSLGLQVAMHDAAVMRRCQCVRDL